MPVINIKKLDSDAAVPTMANDHPAGFDLYANQEVVIPGRSVKTIGTGLAFEVSKEYFIEIAERSGFSINTPLSKKAGIIDPDYRGEVKIVMQNVSDFPFTVRKGEKIAQAILRRRYKVELKEVEEFKNPDTKRGDKGFGSSGN